MKNSEQRENDRKISDDLRPYVYLLEPITERSKKEPIVPLHLEYLNHLAQEKRLVVSGGFEDKSGGLVCILAQSDAEAQEIAENDPFIRYGVDRIVWIKKWNVRVTIPLGLNKK